MHPDRPAGSPLRSLFAATLLLLLTAAVAAGQSPVEVVNFPEVQPVSGEVSVSSPIPHSTFRTVSALVSPTSRGELSNAQESAVVSTAGFTEMMLSLHGEMRATLFREGQIGAILVPDEPSVLEDFRDRGPSTLSLEAVAPVNSARTTWLSSTPTRVPVAFPRYRVLFYNSSDKTAAVDLHLYLTQ